MKKKLTLAVLAAVVLSLTSALAQDNKPTRNFYEVVPKHEFFIEGFGGLGTLMYGTNAFIVGTQTEQTAGVPPKVPAIDPHLFRSDLFNWPNKTGLGYGGGIGYIWHFTPVWGLMLGAEFAVYNGGIRMLGTQDDNTGYLFTSDIVKPEGFDFSLIGLEGIMEYQETQKYMAVQVPLMFQVMAPMGRGNHFFYFAFGGKAAFNVHSTFKGQGKSLAAVWLEYPEKWTPTSEFANTLPFLAMAEKGTYGPDQYIANARGNLVEEDYTSEGKLRTRLVNPMASAEIGFRWRLGGGCGLYTGLYADYGFLTLTPGAKGGLVVFDPSANGNEHTPQSLLNAQAAPDMDIRLNEETVPAVKEYRFKTPGPAVKAVNALHAGLKLKLAFGKVRKPFVPAPVPPKPDTVVKTVVQTVVVRDTVTRDNTIVVRDTVEKVKVVRDTVVVIKEVPQEIKDVMVELSNTLFAFNKFNLNDKAQAGLNKVAKWLNDNPDINVEISGHTDSVGSEAYNQKLSEERAKSVYEYFIHHGVSSNRLSYKGYGKSRPIATNDTDEGRQQNRRVELNIIQ